MNARSLHAQLLLVAAAVALQGTVGVAHLPSLPLSDWSQAVLGAAASDLDLDPDAAPPVSDSSSDEEESETDSDDDDSKASPDRLTLTAYPSANTYRIDLEETPPAGPHREPLPRPPRA